LVIRDASLKKQHAPQLTQIMRDVERWVSEARVAAITAENGMGWQAGRDEGDERASSSILTRERGDEDDEDDATEIWSLERLCDALLEPGVIVPESKRYLFHGGGL
jgi:ribosomal biogenesis protein LAS1